MPVTPLRGALAALAAMAVTLLAVPMTLPAAAAPAEPDDGAKVTWTVQPAKPNGPDGRRWIEHTLDPGQAVTEHLAVRNFSDTAAVFALKAADGYLTDAGRFNMLPSDRRSIDSGTWVTVQPTVKVGPKETKVVPFTITAPQGATPGDHPAGIAATITATGGTVNVESRVGFRLMLRISGEVRPALTVKDLTATYTPSWNPFSAGTVRIRYTVVNDGNVRVAGTGRGAVAGGLGPAGRDASVTVEELYPGGSRVVEARVRGVWALGRLRASVAVTPAPLGGDPAGAQARPVSAAATTWALPWSQLVLAVVVAALLVGGRTLVRRRRRRMTRLIARAREEGRKAALAGG